MEKRVVELAQLVARTLKHFNEVIQGGLDPSDLYFAKTGLKFDIQDIEDFVDALQEEIDEKEFQDNLPDGTVWDTY